MKEVIIYVEKHEDGTYWGTTQNFEGIVSSYGSTMEELKANIADAFADNLEIAQELGEDYASQYEHVKFTYKLNLKSFFDLVREVKISNIAEKAGINPSLLRRYKLGETASEEQLKKIETAVHRLGEELLSVAF